jgi:Uma2 family endonuclease
MMSSAEKPKHLSVEEYLAAEEIAFTKSEYIDGWVRAMVGSTLRHNQVKANCLVCLALALKGRRCKPYDSDTKVRIVRKGRTRFYYPDVQVVCESNAPTDVYQDSPVLIIEVLSPSTRRYDLDEKMSAFLDIPSLEYYLVLEQHCPSAILMRRTGDCFVREIYNDLDSTIDLSLLGCSLPLREIYDGIEFTETCVQEPEPEYEVT